MVRRYPSAFAPFERKKVRDLAEAVAQQQPYRSVEVREIWGRRMDGHPYPTKGI